MDLLGLDGDGDSLALGKELLAIGLGGEGELTNVRRALTVVGDQGSNALKLTSVLALDLDIGAVRVQLTVADCVVPISFGGL